MLRTPQGRRLYRERVGTLFTNIFKVNALTNRVNELEAQVFPALLEQDKNAAREFKNQAAGLRSRIEQRITNLEKLIALPEPKPLKFENGFVKVTGWRTQDEQGGAKLDEVKDAEGKPTLHIAAKSSSAASWRSRVLLPGGRYRFEALARTAGVVPVKDAKKGEGAGLRISGSEKPRPNKLSGDAAWQKLGYEFEASSPEDEVELVCELRASKGEVWFDAGSLQLVRIK